MKKMRGIIDPYSLGFLIMLIGGTTTYIVHKDDERPSAVTARDSEQVEFPDNSTSEKD